MDLTVLEKRLVDAHSSMRADDCCNELLEVGTMLLDECKRLKENEKHTDEYWKGEVREMREYIKDLERSAASAWRVRE